MNGEPITEDDIRQRIVLIRILQNAYASVEKSEKMALEELIDDDDLVLIEQLATTAKVPLSELLEKLLKSVDLATVRQKAKAEIAWKALIELKGGRPVSLKNEMHVRKISLPFSSPANQLGLDGPPATKQSASNIHLS